MKKRSLNTHLNEETVTRYLSSLADEELREILFNVFQSKQPGTNDDPTTRSTFFLGMACQDKVSTKEKAIKWGEPTLWTVAYIDRERSPISLGPDWGFVQYGKCYTCDILVCSNYKEGLCPVCLGKVSMT